jgi:hypothetical protein
MYWESLVFVSEGDKTEQEVGAAYTATGIFLVGLWTFC